MTLEDFIDDWGKGPNTLNLAVSISESDPGDDEHPYVILYIAQTRKNRIQEVVVDGVTPNDSTIAQWLDESYALLKRMLRREP